MICIWSTAACKKNVQLAYKINQMQLLVDGRLIATDGHDISVVAIFELSIDAAKEVCLERS